MYLYHRFGKRLLDPSGVKRVVTNQTQEPTRSSQREKKVLNYSDPKEYKVLDDSAELKWTRLLGSKIFKNGEFIKLKGSELTLDYLRTFGFKEPILIPSKEGLGLKMPSGLTVRAVAEAVGLDAKVPVLQVSDQSELVMTMGNFAKYFESKDRKKIYNVISLEISKSYLASQILRPKVVRQLDWIDHVWPKELKENSEFPRVQLYCLMSVKNSFTDFHIDFGGTSVFYHILSGEKIFYFIRPTEENLKRYASWSSSDDQSLRFFGDEVEDCFQTFLSAGNT